MQNGTQLAIISLLGRTNFNKIFPNDPFFTVDKLLEKVKEVTNNIVVDFHGGTTSEIQSMQWYLAGKVSFVAGTHLRVLTSDNRIIEDGTAVITGTGFCGGHYSVSGLSPETEIKKIKTGQFVYSKVSDEKITIQGTIVEIDETTGKATSIELFNKLLEE